MGRIHRGSLVGGRERPGARELQATIRRAWAGRSDMVAVGQRSGRVQRRMEVGTSSESQEKERGRRRREQRRAEGKTAEGEMRRGGRRRK
jgi:hypothetical protein